MKCVCVCVCLCVWVRSVFLATTVVLDLALVWYVRIFTAAESRNLRIAEARRLAENVIVSEVASRVAVLYPPPPSLSTQACMLARADRQQKHSLPPATILKPSSVFHMPFR